MGRKVEETIGGRRLVKIYGDDGKLARIRVEPLAPPPGSPTPRASFFSFLRKPRASPPPPATSPPEPPRPAPVAAAPPPPPPRQEELPVTVEPYVEPTPEVFPSEELPVTVEPYEPPARIDPAPPLQQEAWEQDEPAPWSPPRPEPERAPEPEPLVEFVEEPEPAPIVVEDAPPAPPPARRKSFAILAVERVELAPETLSEGIDEANVDLAPSQPAHEPPPQEPEPTPEPAPPAAEPEPIPGPAPERYDVPDLEAKVDALFARRDRPVKARKRAPLPVPQFEPLRREAWEDRLDAALGKS